MEIQNIIFDLGGVLIEWDPDGIITKFTDDLELGVILRREIFDHPDWNEKDRGALPVAEINRRFASRTGLAEGEIAAFMDIIRTSLPLMEETLPLMDELRQQGYSLYCLSNMPVEHYDHLTKCYDFWEKFDGIVISGQIKLVKPETEIYQHLLNTFALEPSTCVFLDDSPKNIAAAQDEGIHGIVFQDVDSCRKELKQRFQVGK